MGSMFEWQPQFSVGHPVLDDEHRWLLSICKRASICMADSSDQCIKEFHDILNDLMRYATKHFVTEERILLEFGYGNLTEQKAEHEAYLVQLIDFMPVATWESLDREGIMKLLTDWWLQHVLVADMRFRPLFEALDPQQLDTKLILAEPIRLVRTEFPQC